MEEDKKGFKCPFLDWSFTEALLACRINEKIRCTYAAGSRFGMKTLIEDTLAKLFTRVLTQVK